MPGPFVTKRRCRRMNSPKYESLTESQYAERAHAFARLVADWFWELDSELRYVFHDGHLLSITGVRAVDLRGRYRIEVMQSWLESSPELEQHNMLLRSHQSVDMVLPVKQIDGSFEHIHIIAEPQFDASGEFSGYLGCGRKVTDSVKLKEKLAHLATHDDLTGVFNRREFELRLKRTRDLVQGSQAKHVLCFVDLDRFKLVNDTAGHPAGDQLLRELTAVMRKHLRRTETLARLGGDEFGLLLDGTCLEAQVLSERLIEAISNHEFIWEGCRHTVGACVGITPIVNGCGSVEELLARADSACYVAKNNGRNQSHVFSPDSLAYHQYRKELAQITMIEEALRKNRFSLYMQAIMPADRSLARSHYEVLLRLECEDGSLLSPGAFIPIAERFNIMPAVDRWVIEHTLKALEMYAEHGKEVSMSINLSGNTLSDQNSLDRVIELINASPLPAQLLCFEITETAAIRNIDAVVNFMHALKLKGVKFALDDFGVGLSSFAYLKSLPINYLKIDGSFIRNIALDPTSRAITSSFIQLSHELDIKTVAEFVENDAIRDQVTAMGIDYLQGYGIAKPVALDSALAQAVAEAMPKASGY